MSNSSSERHGGESPMDGVSATEPSHAERARTLLHIGRIGSLSTLSQKRPGFPFGSVMPYGLDPEGRPTFLISTMAMHTQNILHDPRASLLVVESDADGDPLGASRVTLMGAVSQVPEAELAAVKECYLSRYENARYWVDFKDFAFYRLEVEEVYFVGGFGVMGWVTAAQYCEAEVDPLAELASGIIEHMNEDHADALLLLARHFDGSAPDEVKMTAVDRLGFDLQLKTADEVHGTRIQFIREARNAKAVREVLVEMVQNARAQA